MFWLMLSYFESFPGFATPQPLLEAAVARLLQHGDQEAWSKFNQWVLTTRPVALQMLDLSIVGKVAASLQPAALSRLQRVLEDSEEVVVCGVYACMHSCTSLYICFKKACSLAHFCIFHLFVFVFKKGNKMEIFNSLIISYIIFIFLLLFLTAKSRCFHLPNYCLCVIQVSVM